MSGRKGHNYKSKKAIMRNRRGTNRAPLRFDPSQGPLSKQKFVEFYQTWDYFENINSYIIEKNILARKDFYPPLNSDFYFLGRQRQDGSPTVVRISNYQGAQLCQYIDVILSQYFECLQKHGRYTSIPAIEGKEKHYPWRGNRVEFWKTPDIDLGKLRIALAINRNTGEPELLLNNTVRPDVTQQYGFWPGPTICLSIDGMSNLEAFFREVSGDYSCSPMCSPDPTPPPTPSPTVSPYKISPIRSPSPEPIEYSPIDSQEPEQLSQLFEF